MLITIKNPKARAADLRRAADLLVRDGWTTGEMKDNEGFRCTAGAILDAAHSEAKTIEAFVAYMLADPGRFEGYLPDETETCMVETIACWNDFGAGTAEVAIATLRDAATWVEGRPVDA